MRELVGSDCISTAASVVPLDYGGPIEVPFERFEDRWVERPIFDRFAYMVERYGNRTAVDDGLVCLTYRGLMQICVQLALEIDALVTPQAPVGILMPNCAFVPIAALACLAVRRPFVYMDSNYPALRNEQIMADAGVRTLLIEQSSGDAAKPFAAIPQLDITRFLNTTSNRKIACAAANGPAILLYTSGSTGRPKGICIDQRSISRKVAEYTNSCHLNADDRIVLLGTASTVAGLRNIFGALLNGAPLYIADPRTKGIDGVLEILQQRRITICLTVPALLRELATADAASSAFADLRMIKLAGDTVRARDIRLFRKVLPSTCHIQIAYGLTETDTVFQWFVPKDWVADGPRMPCGYPMPGRSIWLDPVDGMPSTCGEVVVKSRYHALGLWQTGSLQQGPYAQDPDDPSLRVLCTGDLAKLRDDGLFEIIGRRDRQVKIRGLRVHPAEIEDVLCRCDGVSEVVVTARQDKEDIVALTAYVVPIHTPGGSFLKDLQAIVAKHLPGYLRPSYYRVVSKIPLLPNFKPDIVALERLAASDVADLDTPETTEAPTIVSPRVRDAVSQAWAQLMGQKSLAANTPWSETGGDSLKKLRLWLDIEKALGIRLPFAPFDDGATPNELGVHVQKVVDVSGHYMTSMQDLAPENRTR